MGVNMHECVIPWGSRRHGAAVLMQPCRDAGCHTSADDERLRLDELSHRPEKVYDAAAIHRRSARAARRAGFDSATRDARTAPTPANACSSRPPTRAATTCGARRVSARGSVRGPSPRRPAAGAVRLARAHRRDGARWRAASHSHVVRYDRRSALSALRIRSLMPLRTAPAWGAGFALCVTAPGPGTGGQRTFA